MISIQVKQPSPGVPPEEVEVHLDEEGLQSLLAQLQFIKEGRTDHIHLMSESWGGAELADQPEMGDGIAIRHVKILLRAPQLRRHVTSS